MEQQQHLDQQLQDAERNDTEHLYGHHSNRGYSQGYSAHDPASSDMDHLHMRSPPPAYSDADGEEEIKAAAAMAAGTGTGAGASRGSSPAEKQQQQRPAPFHRKTSAGNVLTINEAVPRLSPRGDRGDRATPPIYDPDSSPRGNRSARYGYGTVTDGEKRLLCTT